VTTLGDQYLESLRDCVGLRVNVALRYRDVGMAHKATPPAGCAFLPKAHPIGSRRLRLADDHAHQGSLDMPVMK